MNTQTHTEIKGEVYNKLKPLLKRGAIKRVAEKHEVSQVYVSNVLSGKYEDPMILTSLYDEAKSYKNIQNKILADL